MFYTAKTLVNYKLKSQDGEIGKVKDFYFHDPHWAIRYLIADTGNWLMDKLVLISPYALKAVTYEDKIINVNLTKKQIEESPSLETDKPVSRQFENDFYGYYGWPTYWSGSWMWGVSPYLNQNIQELKEEDEHKKTWDSHLRSIDAVTGYNIQAIDGEIGHIEDFIIDEESWAIRYLIIDTQNWWPGKKVIIAPQWIESVNWGESKVVINLPRESIKQAPLYLEESLLSRDFEENLHRHYNRHGYWEKP